MGQDSKIEWTHHTFNPVIGCARKSPGCEHCYAEAESKRRGWAKWGVNGTRHVTSDAYWLQPLKWNRAAEKAGERHRVFCASLSDAFEDHPAWREPRIRLRALIAKCPWLDFLLLTKRPENAAELMHAATLHAWDGGMPDAPDWPENVWLGATVEDQKRADERIPALLAVPAAVRFLSCEPLLEAVNLSSPFRHGGEPEKRVQKGIHWVIVGGESGPGARPFELKWARDIVAMCRNSEVPVLVKQLGAQPMVYDRFLNMPSNMLLKDRRKGGDWSEWPADLRIREYPVRDPALGGWAALS